ncbi:MAG: glycine zipper 2TM domain-containing protein [Burkholderiales bacterium]|nr:glycine zipper 2TM domain-containing protein [Burkholderiales bacterium]
MKTRSLLWVGLFVVGSLAGCATPDQRQTSSDPGYSSYSSYGIVDSIQQSGGGVANSGIGAGTIIGGVVGGVLGNQVGGGTGKTIATVAGVAGGALIGHEVDKNRQAKNPTYAVRVRLNNGDFQTMNLDNVGDLRVGDRVRIENNQLYRY